MDLLWYSLVAAYMVGLAIYVTLGHCAPRCPKCCIPAMILSRQLAGSSPPVFEIIYRCPRCRDILWTRFISSVSE